MDELGADRIKATEIENTTAAANIAAVANIAAAANIVVAANITITMTKVQLSCPMGANCEYKTE